LLVLRDGIAHPTVNLDDPDPIRIILSSIMCGSGFGAREPGS
jgi:hypothetical protein